MLKGYHQMSLDHLSNKKKNLLNVKRFTSHGTRSPVKPKLKHVKC